MCLDEAADIWNSILDIIVLAKQGLSWVAAIAAAAFQIYPMKHRWSNHHGSQKRDREGEKKGSRGSDVEYVRPSVRVKLTKETNRWTLLLLPRECGCHKLVSKWVSNQKSNPKSQIQLKCPDSHTRSIISLEFLYLTSQDSWYSCPMLPDKYIMLYSRSI